MKYCLLLQSAHMMTLRSWREVRVSVYRPSQLIPPPAPHRVLLHCRHQRIDCLLKQEHFVEALSLAWSFHEGTAKAVVGGFVPPE